MRRPTAVLLTLLASAALAAPAGAADAPTSYFFACTDGAKYQGNRAQTWSTTRPTGSLRGGAGCGSLDLGLQGGRLAGHEWDFYGGGTHTGPIQAINVELHSLLLSQARTPPDIGGMWELRIDGERVLFDNVSRIAPEVSADGLTERYVFSFSYRRPSGASVAPPLAGDGEHTVDVRFSSRFLDYQNLWVWGADDVAAGVVLNPERLAFPRITGDPLE